MLRKKAIFFLNGLVLCLVGCATGPSVSPYGSDFNRFVTASQQDYPEEGYLIALGDGLSPSAASESAQAAVAKIFSARIEEDLLVSQESLSINDKDIRSQYLSRSVLVSARSDIEGIEVPEIFYSEAKDSYFALAVLDRNEAKARWLDELKEYQTSIAQLKADLSQDIAPYRTIYKLRLLHQAILQHNQRILKLQIVKPQDGYETRPDDTARRMKAATARMGFAVMTIDDELAVWIVATLGKEGMPLSETADILIEAETQPLPLRRLDEWFIAQTSLKITIVSNHTSPKTLVWQPQASSVREEEAWERLRQTVRKAIEEELFAAVIDSLNEDAL